jgi:UDP-glucose 4-epimerase
VPIGDCHNATARKKDRRPRRAVVTGGAGFIGRHLVARLGDAFVIDQQIGPPVHLAAWPTPRVIFHLAGPVGPVALLSNRGQIVPTIVRDAAVVAQQALDAACPIIFASTSELYGDQPSDGITEDAPLVFGPVADSRREYTAGKLAAETMLLNTPGLDVRVVRFFNVVGPGQRAAGGFVMARWAEAVAGGRPIEVYGTGSQIRSFCHVDDAVTALLLIAERGTPGTVYHVGNPANSTTIRDLADKVAQLSGAVVAHVDPRAIHGPDFREPPDKVRPSIARIQALGWRPRHDLDAIVASILRDVLPDPAHAPIVASV